MLQQTEKQDVEESQDRIIVRLRPWAKQQERFSLGRVAVSSAAAGMLDPEEIGLALSRHLVGDWGEVGDIEKLLNDCCLDFGGELRSAYLSGCGERFLVLTDGERQTTTVLSASDV